MFHAPRHDEELPRFELNVPFAEADAESSLYDEEKFVLAIVPVPDEFTCELGQLDLLPVQLADDSGAPARPRY